MIALLIIQLITQVRMPQSVEQPIKLPAEKTWRPPVDEWNFTKKNIFANLKDKIMVSVEITQAAL